MLTDSVGNDPASESRSDHSSSPAIDSRQTVSGPVFPGAEVVNTKIVNIGLSEDGVRALIDDLNANYQHKPFDGRCPYVGLDSFSEEDADRFFGRETLVDELVKRILELRFIVIAGPSGSGKSSLVRAGLIHVLKQGAISNSDRWLYAFLNPGRDPIESLAQAMSRLAKSPEASDFIRSHMSEPDALHKLVESVLSDLNDQRAVIFVDQFEEAFTQVPKEKEGQRVAFLNLLMHAATVENGRVTVLLAMRSEFVSSCATYPQLNALLNRQFMQVGSMQTDELVSAISLPALKVGLRIDPDLVVQVVNDMHNEPGILPLMQFALKDLFDTQQAAGGVIALTRSDYLARGGLYKALERHAEESIKRLTGREQQLARTVFSSLIEPGRGTPDTRRTAFFDELVPAYTLRTDIEAIIRKLADASARLLTTDEQDHRVTVTLAHEQLIDAWPWLKKLVNENRDIIAMQNEIASNAEEWEKNKNDISYLYSGARLATIQEKIKVLVLNDHLQAFLEASIKAEKNIRNQSERTKRRIIAGLITFSGLILGLLIFSLSQLNISRAQQLGSQAQAAFAEQNYNAALLYAFQSNQIHKNDAADLVLDNIVYRNFAGGKQLFGHTLGVNSVAWSADGQLASGSNDNTVIIWDLKTGQPAQTLNGHTLSVKSVAWSKDGQLASGSLDNTVIIWDIKTSQPAQTLNGHGSYVNSVAWSVDEQLASGSPNITALIIWDLKTGQPAQTLKGYTDFVTSVDWSADGRLALGSTENTVIIWDIKTSQPAQTLQGHSYSVNSVAWSADGQLASGSWDNTVIIWDLKTGRPAQTLKGHTDVVTSVSWSADGQLASSSRDNSVIIWDFKTGQPAQILKGHADIVNSIAWSADGQLASGSNDDTVIIWDLETGQPAQTLKEHTISVASVAWSTDGRLASGSWDKSVIIWDLKSGQPAQALKGYTSSVNSVSWSADGQLASGSRDSKVIIWDLKTGQPAQTLKGHGDIVTSVAWSANGQLASGSNDYTVIIWDRETGQPARTLIRHKDIVTSVAWSVDGRLASGSQDDTVIIWDLETGQPAQTLKGHTDNVTSVAWSADGRLASGSGDNTVIVWDLRSGQSAQTLKGHAAIVNSVVWSADGRLASGSSDKALIVWDLKSGKPAQSLKGYTDSVISLAWSAEGQLASGEFGGTIKITRADLTGSDPCIKIIRNMTLNEWLDSQGILYVYQPACPNLYDPSLTLNPTSEIMESIEYTVTRSISAHAIKLYFYIPKVLITWKGRAILFTFICALLVFIICILWIFFKFVIWVWRIRERFFLNRGASSNTG